MTFELRLSNQNKFFIPFLAAYLAFALHLAIDPVALSYNQMSLKPFQTSC